MSLRHPINLFRSVAFRLTVWYASIFTVSTCIAFFFFYILIDTVVTSNTDQDLLGQISSFSSVLSLKGINAVKQVAVLEAQAAGEKKLFFRMLYLDGRVFSSSNMSYWRNIGIDFKAIQQLINGRRHVFDTMTVPDHTYDIRILYGFIGQGIIMQVGQSMESQTRILDVFKKIFVLTMTLLIIIAALIGWFMARKALSGVETVRRTALQISLGDLDKRVPVKTGKDELDQLAITFNQMLDRIQLLIKSIKELSDNMAHDLKSPITRIRGIAEVTLTTAKTNDEYEKMIANTIEECDRLLDIINTMLVISKTDTGVEEITSVKMDIADIVRIACDLFAATAEDKEIKLICHAPERCNYQGDIRMIQRLVANLIDNAVKYTDSGGTIDVDVVNNTDHVYIKIHDTGIGIKEDDIPNIFERFYRCDPSRSRSGMGLGLSLARAIAKAHGGNISVASAIGIGSTFTVTLPRIHHWV